ncbi:TetR family transcriptional regulator [Fuerstiella marisgermanici]|uniref:DNA-binding transcriptional repressor AcrR n=1 Tax=Fuerstiella marisgermanici TaxID=1891926 RepID=A0A1P8WEV9_9PLAN|nr:TetR family transcriptional regulator [Fuerstiella marisgermanici]APZ92571.1 DNA-binding transcriptional repressor AcrR [Fuerstiella marisgermanici]
MTTRSDSAALTRENLLNQALTLFSERGYSATRIRDIIQAAGVTQ